MDVSYVDNFNLALDFSMLASTLVSVLRREGIAAEGSSTVPEFTGPARDWQGEGAPHDR